MIGLLLGRPRQYGAGILECFPPVAFEEEGEHNGHRALPRLSRSTDCGQCCGKLIGETHAGDKRIARHNVYDQVGREVVMDSFGKVGKLSLLRPPSHLCLIQG